ncbi:MAG: hypothetical protein ACK420_00535, partial [Sphingomonadales bacterium]
MSETLNQITQINVKSSDDKFTPTELLWKYLAYLPLILLCVGIALAIGVAITRYTPRVYKAGTRVFIRIGQENRLGSGNRGGAQNDLIESALFGSKQVNIDNEIVLITRGALMTKVVERNGFNHYYYDEGNIRASEVYKQAPFEVSSAVWVDSTASFSMRVDKINAEGARVALAK